MHMMHMMHMMLPIALATAPAADDRPNSIEVAYIATMAGTCQKLILSGDGDKTSRCSDKIVNVAYLDASASFRITLDDMLVIEFYGDDQGIVDDAAVVAVRKILITKRPNDRSDMFEAQGECRYTNPNAGPAHFECKAATSQKSYEFSFVTDGNPPTLNYGDSSPPQMHRY